MTLVLYSLSAGAGYKITGDERCKQEVLAAAEVLSARFQENGSFIQAWGHYGDPKEYRLIIDSLMNLPLLFEATKLSGNRVYEEIASRHYHTLMKTVIKSDATTYHTYYFDPETGKPKHGATHQGHSDTSIWARGQSWAILGIPLNETFLHSQPFPEMYPQIVEVFLAHLPADLIPYWDFDFNDQMPSDKDSSALAIAACGLLEADKLQAFPQAKELAKGMIYQLENIIVRKMIPKMKDCYSMVFTHMQKEKGLMNPIYGAIILHGSLNAFSKTIMAKILVKGKMMQTFEIKEDFY